MSTSVKLNAREIADALEALDYAMEDYMSEGRAATTDEEIHLYEAKAQRAAALHYKLTAAQLKAQ
jgi:hypothetical protein